MVAGICIMAEIKKDRDWQTKYNEEHKLRQEAQGELTIIKGIGNNSPEMKELQARVKQLDKLLSNALEINETHQRYNGKLQTHINLLKTENEKLKKQNTDYIKHYENNMRKGL